MFNPGPCFYMKKIAVGPRGRGAVDVNASATDNLTELSKRLNKPVQEMGVVILDRPRHDDLVAEVREAGARVISITDGDVAGAIATGWPNSGVDVLLGIGGTPEGVIAAAALKGLGGEIQGVLHADNDEERREAEALGYSFSRVMTADDLVASDDCFFSATAITDGDFLRGVRFYDFGATTQSLVVRSRSGTIRTIETFHRHDKLQEFTTAGFCRRAMPAPEVLLFTSSPVALVEFSDLSSRYRPDGFHVFTTRRRVTMKVSQLLTAKGHEVATISQERSVTDAHRAAEGTRHRGTRGDRADAAAGGHLFRARRGARARLERREGAHAQGVRTHEPRRGDLQGVQPK